MESLRDLLSRASEVANNQKFRVRIVGCDDRTESEMSYMELGTFLTTKCGLIKRVEIVLRD